MARLLDQKHDRAEAPALEVGGAFAMAGSLIRLARPTHWIKNVFVLMPLPFAMVAGARADAVTFAIGLLGFCLVNSAVYVFNDVRDASGDRLHPRKRHRPVASGAVSWKNAVAFSVVLLGTGVALVATTGSRAAVQVTLLYLAVNLVYSLGAKHQALLDVFLLSAGFVIRVFLGCILVGVTPSHWLLLCSSALALFLGFAKRRADLSQGMTTEHRASLAGYTMEFLDHGMTIAACIALLSYALYSMNSEVLLPGREMASMPFVVYGVLFYLREAHVGRAGESPVDIALRSKTIWACLLGWSLTIAWSLGLA